MAHGFLDRFASPSLDAARAAAGVAERWATYAADRPNDRFGPNETAFAESRDSFYMATTSETGWPYVQHRGGPEGFLRALDDRTLGFADFRGNRQYLSLGNLGANDRVALFLMDYPARARLKILARAELSTDPATIARLMPEGYRAVPERAILFRLAAFDWNCSQHITPRHTEADVSAAMAELRRRLEAAEAENAALKARLDQPSA